MKVRLNGIYLVVVRQIHVNLVSILDVLVLYTVIVHFDNVIHIYLEDIDFIVN